MLVSATPGVIDALVTQATSALPSVFVIDGPGMDFGSEGDYLLVGVDDPDRQDAQDAAQASQTWPYAGNLTRDERGSMMCVAYSWRGDTDQKTVRDAVYATAGAVQNFMAADPSLGLSYLKETEFGADQRFSQDLADGGVAAKLTFQVAWHALLT